MSTPPSGAKASVLHESSSERRSIWRELVDFRRLDRTTIALAVCAVPISIAVTEMLLGAAILFRLARVIRGQDRVLVPRIFWLWAIWAGLEVISWSFSPELRPGSSEVRHLLLLAALFFLLPAVQDLAYRRTIWQGIFLTATLCALFLIGDFFSRLVYYRREIPVAVDPSLYLRTGGLLNNWMVYATVEILVVAGMLSFWDLYPELRRRWLPVFTINALAIIVSLTRMSWLCCVVMAGIVLVWRRSKWLLILPLLPLVAYFLGPSVIRIRIRESLNPNYYSNHERVQMLQVGWMMIKQKPLTGIGPGRVNEVYTSYLSPGEPVPAYHGHLHNNLVQLAATFGLPVAIAAVVFVVALFRDLLRALKSAACREERFLCETAVLALTGFLLAGMFDYTYGHSLGLILLSFAVIPVLLTVRRTASYSQPMPTKTGDLS